MEHLWSPRERAAAQLRRGRYVPQVDLLEDRLAPGDTVLSQVLGLSLFGSGLGLGDSSVSNIRPETVSTAELRLVGPGQVVQAGVFLESAGSYAAPQGASAPGARPTTILGGFEATPFQGFTLADPLDDGVFSAVAATPAHVVLRQVGNTVAMVGDGTGLATFGGGTLIGTVAETPAVIGPAASELAAGLQWNADGSSIFAAPGAAGNADEIAYLARNGYLPSNYNPQTAANDLATQLRGQANFFPPQVQERMQALLSNLENGGSGTRGPGDPAATGPLAVTRIEYNLGATAFQPPGFPGPVEIQATVHFPTNLPGGPYPLVVFMHGRHATCNLGGSAFLEWPCSAGRTIIPSYTGYDYIGQVLSSWGYVVASVGANGVNARDNTVNDLGALARAQTIQQHLDLWNTWSTTGGGPAGIGDAFIGKVDMQNIGTMGHSRGGEGVIRHYVHNASLGFPYWISAVIPLAATDFSRFMIGYSSQLHMLPYCDGDVSDLQGMHAFDDVRYTPTAGEFAFNTVITTMGANHNFFNTIWTPGGWPAGTADDWGFADASQQNPHCGTNNPNNRRLTAAQQRAVGLAYIAGFVRTFVGGEYNFLPYFTGDFVPPTLTAFDNRVSYHPPAYQGYRMDVNRLLAAAQLTTNTLGGAVTQGNLVAATYELCGGEVPQAQHCLTGQSTARLPHTTPSARSPLRGLSQLRLVWDTPTAFYENDLPAGSRDLSAFSLLQFRTGLNYADTARNPVDQAQDFAVSLTDGGGHTYTHYVSWWSNALAYPPGTGTNTRLPKHINNTVRIFLQGMFPGVDLTDVRSIRFDMNLTPRGHITLTDILFAAY